MGHHQGIPMRNKKRRKPAIRYVVIAFFTLAIILAAKSEIPAFSRWLDTMLHPELAHATSACQQKALAAADSPHATILLPGSAVKADDGFAIEGILVSDGDKEFAYTCYADREGNVLRYGKAD